MMIGLINLFKAEGKRSPLKKIPQKELVAVLTNFILEGSPKGGLTF
jgi:hypothetical protein